jgi:hypothetical protein
MDNVTSDGTLVINKVTKKHEGYYACEANNEVGSPIISIIRLNVQGEWCLFVNLFKFSFKAALNVKYMYIVVFIYQPIISVLKYRII